MHPALISAGGRGRRCGPRKFRGTLSLRRCRCVAGRGREPRRPHGALSGPPRPWASPEVPPRNVRSRPPRSEGPGRRRRFGRLWRPLRRHIPSRAGGDARGSGHRCPHGPGTPPQPPAAPRPRAPGLLALRLHPPPSRARPALRRGLQALCPRRLP